VRGTLTGMANWNLEVHLTWRGGAVVVTPRGEIDLLTVSQLEDALRRATWVRPKTVVVDLTETEFLACCGIGALAVVRTTLAASGRTLVVTGAHGQVRRLLELCGEPPGDAVPMDRAS
jgi:anti-sigma B factor antagonist